MPEDLEVTYLPGFSGNLASKHYSGYITVDEEHGRNLYYYFVTSEGDPASDPLVLWLNGGPGCSSFDGYVYEHGPFLFYPGERRHGGLPRLEPNPYSWSKVASIIYLDSPAFVGLSYSDTFSDHVTDDLKTAADSHTFLLKWLNLYPEFRSNPFWITGESYGGIYVPTLAREVADGIDAGVEPKINFQGYMVGNGCTDPEFDGNALIPFVYGMGLIDVDLYKSLQTVCNGTYWNASEAHCLELLERVGQDTGSLNLYDILEDCYHQPTPTPPPQTTPSPDPLSRAVPLHAWRTQPEARATHNHSWEPDSLPLGADPSQKIVQPSPESRLTTFQHLSSAASLLASSALSLLTPASASALTTTSSSTSITSASSSTITSPSTSTGTSSVSSASVSSSSYSSSATSASSASSFTASRGPPQDKAPLRHRQHNPEPRPPFLHDLPSANHGSQLLHVMRTLGEHNPSSPRTRVRMWGRGWPLQAPVLPGRVRMWQELMDDANVQVPCMDDHIASIWLNNDRVRKAIHAQPVSAIGEWYLCTGRIDFDHNAGSMIPIHRNLTQKGYKALIYSGDHDMCVPYTGSEAWTRSLGYPVVDNWRPWFLGDQVAGFTRQYDFGLTFATIKGAGHTVPEYKPAQALAFFNRFLNGDPL